jgi:uncharacterized circularly permuted ATP-grasp superfamily protein
VALDLNRFCRRRYISLRAFALKCGNPVRIVAAAFGTIACAPPRRVVVSAVS